MNNTLTVSQVIISFEYEEGLEHQIILSTPL